MVTVIAMEVLPEERDRKYYADNYSCCPPPLFIIFITLVEVSSLPPFRYVKPDTSDFMCRPTARWS